MPALLADVNAEGHLDALLAVCRSPDWIEYWSYLQVSVERFSDLGLPANVSDDVLWRTCQQRELLLVTANRNQDGPDSLGVTIALEGTADSLPVLTLGDAGRLLTDGDYCRAAAARLIEIIEDLDIVRGSGRLWLP